MFCTELNIFAKNLLLVAMHSGIEGYIQKARHLESKSMEQPWCWECIKMQFWQAIQDVLEQNK